LLCFSRLFTIPKTSLLRLRVCKIPLTNLDMHSCRVGHSSDGSAEEGEELLNGTRSVLDLL
jgi:hypothetical protein